MKIKALILNVSRYQLDNGVRGGKMSWTDLATTQNENRRGLEIYTATAPFEAFGQLPSVPCVAEITLSMKSATSNGKAVTQIVVDAVSPLTEKKFSSESGEYVLK